MAKTYRTDERVPAPAADVLRLLVDAGEQEALLRHLGTPEVRCDVGEEIGGRVRVTVDTTEPAMMGAGSHRATLEMDWDLEARSCTWVRRDHTFGERVKARGTTRVEADGDSACRVIEEGEIDVSIPVVGRRISKAVIGRIVDQAPRKAAWWRGRLE